MNHPVRVKTTFESLTGLSPATPGDNLFTGPCTNIYIKEYICQTEPAHAELYNVPRRQRP